MDLFKNLGDKAKSTAKIVGEKSSDLVEIGKLKVNISQLENDIRRAKTDIGNIFYNAYANSGDIPNEAIISLCEEIKDKYDEIGELKEKVENL